MSKLTQLASIALGSLILSGSSRGMDVRNYFPENEVEALANSSAAGRIGAADRALKLGADPNFSGKNGMTPLIWTLIHGNKAGFPHLLARRGNPNQEMADGRSVMSLTAQQEDAWFLTAALAHGGDPNVRSNQDQTTPIFDAILARRAGNVEILLRHGANPNAVMSWGESPLSIPATAAPPSRGARPSPAPPAGNSSRAAKGPKLFLARSR